MTDSNTQQGHFSWHELFTNDLEKAKGFYGELLGWTIEPMTMGDGKEYPLIKAGDAGIGGMTPPPMEGAPAHWAGYVTVADVDATAAKMIELGAESLMDAFDVPGVGRIQGISDPQGGKFLLFAPEGDEPNTEAGVGQWHWNELWAKDADAAATFYAEALGLEKKTMEMPNGSYFILEGEGGVPRAGIMTSPDASIPPHWAFYVQVDDVDATRKKAEKLGGATQGDVMEVPGVGRFGFITDREGARLGVIAPS